MIVPRAFVCLLAAGLTSSLAACAPDTSLDTGQDEVVSSDGRDIIGGTSAQAYPSAVLVDLKKNGASVGVCSGAMISPHVVLTAGHCVHGYDGWKVTAPFAGGQSKSSKKGATYDWTSDGEFVDASQHDVGLVFLDGPISLASYPKLAEQRVAWGTKVQNIGRIDNGQTSFSKLFIGPEVAVQNGAQVGYPLSYRSKETIQSGDSGGPVVLPGPAPHTIVAVNSGSGGGIQVLARVDLVFGWIQDAIEAHEGSVTAPPSPPADPCQGITFAGTCQGSTVVWCEGGGLKEIACGGAGKTCGWDGQNGYYNCL